MRMGGDFRPTMRVVTISGMHPYIGHTPCPLPLLHHSPPSHTSGIPPIMTLPTRHQLTIQSLGCSGLCYTLAIPMHCILPHLVTCYHVPTMPLYLAWLVMHRGFMLPYGGHALCACDLHAISWSLSPGSHATRGHGPSCQLSLKPLKVVRASS